MAVRQLRALLRHRASLVRLGTSLRNRIHAVAADHGCDRSGSARKLASWAGLTPTVRGSDLKVRHGHISKMACAGGTGPPRPWEVCDGDGRRIGSAPGSADVRLRRSRHGRVLAGADLARG